MLEKMKRQEQLGKSFEAVEIVRNIVHQSSFPKAISSRKSSTLAKQDTCSYRDDSDQTIMRPIKPGILAHSHDAVDKASQLLEEHAKEIRTSTRHARHVLKSRAFPVDEDLQNELPGGLWKASSKEDNGLRFSEEATKKEQDIPDTPSSQVQGDQQDYWLGDNEIRDIPNPQDDEDSERDNIGLPQWLADEDQNKVTIFDPNMMNKKRDKRVTFADDRATSCGYKKENIQERTNIKGSNRLLRTKAIEDLLKPGKVAEDSKQQHKSQMALYRRLFMDIEREQVRENIRMKEHRKRMAVIKVEKEIERLEVERSHKQMLALEEQQNIDEKCEIQRKEEEGNLDYQRCLQERHAKLQKSKESERFVDAMRAILRDKIQSKGISLPALCACGPSIWDANPDTCANNCIYYKNPKEYAKALSSLLNSLES
jgi:coiled-coil domain-containing protein 15